MRQDHAGAAVPRRGGLDRGRAAGGVHPTPPRRRDDRRVARRGRDGRHAGRGGGLRGAVRERVHPGGHARQVLHRRRAAAGAHGGSAAVEVLGGDGRRGARAFAGHGLTTRAPQEGAAATTGSPDHHRVRHDPGGGVRRFFRHAPPRAQARFGGVFGERALSRARDRLRGGQGAHRADPLPREPGAGLRESRGWGCDRRAPRGGTGRRPRLPHRRRGNRGGGEHAAGGGRGQLQAVTGRRRGNQPCGWTGAIHRASTLRGAVPRATDGGVQARAEVHSKNRGGEQRGGDVGDDRRRGVRRGLLLRETKGVRSDARDGIPAHGGGVQGVR
mmetsp:Transcript_5037/g.20717  ORF Transcript_5037/g.20717 Transcript_5037/m.20717 type:complete len:329 (+) Transcript_5037:289-1275(+)